MEILSFKNYVLFNQKTIIVSYGHLCDALATV